MINKKYEFTGETKEWRGHTLHRIRAIVDIAYAKAGEVGGWIESESNLSENCNAWVCGDAKVYGDAKVCGNAKVYGNAEVCGNAKVEQSSDYIVVKNCWSSMRWFTYTRSNKKWKVGCFHGTGEELIKKAHADSETSGKCYEAIVKAVEVIEEATKSDGIIAINGKSIADRLEAAHKREVDALKQRCAELNAEVAAKDEVIKRLNDTISEWQRRKMATAKESSAVGDCAKLREALDRLAIASEGFLRTHSGQSYADTMEALDKARAALAEPPRNCDMGTAQEQEDGFRQYCNSRGTFCGDCPLYNNRRGECRFAWAQMPYEEGGDK